jgi:hypothetical protein
VKVKRRAPTAREKREISLRQNGVCFLDGCEKPIAVYEHWTMVAIGNGDAPDCGLCEDHADIKTYGGQDGAMWRAVGGDIRDIAHVKRLAEGRTQADKRAERGPKLRSNQKLKSRGFDCSLRKSFSGKVTARNG